LPASLKLDSPLTTSLAGLNTAVPPHGPLMQQPDADFKSQQKIQIAE
jgi:hypothetical protein